MRFHLFALPAAYGLLALLASAVASHDNHHLLGCVVDCVNDHGSKCKTEDKDCLCQFVASKGLGDFGSCLTKKCKDPNKYHSLQESLHRLFDHCSIFDFQIVDEPSRSAELQNASTVEAKATAATPLSIVVYVSTNVTGTYGNDFTDSAMALLSSSSSVGPAVSESHLSTLVSQQASVTSFGSATAPLSTAIASGSTPSPTTSSPPTSTATKSSGSDGTILNVENNGSKQVAGNLLGLSIVLLTAVVCL